MPKPITAEDRARMRADIARGAATLEKMGGTKPPPGVPRLGSYAEDAPEIQGHPEIGPENFPDFDPRK